MFQPLKKLLQNSFLRNLASKTKLTFSRKVQTQSILSQLSRRSFDGCSFINSILCLSVKPSEEDLYQYFENLKVEVTNFFDAVSTHLPSLHEISQEESMSCSAVLAAKVMVTFYDDLYLVSSVVILSKNSDGTWQTIKGRKNVSFFDEQNPIITFQEYPTSIKISFCGGFGDVNNLEQKDFKFNSDFFFAI